MIVPFFALGASAFADPPALVQADEFERVELRVTSSQPRVVIVDRGTGDGLLLRDRVVFRPREGGTFDGVIVRIGERVAVVEPLDPSFVPAPGTRGEVLVPRARFAPTVAPTKPADAQPKEGEKPATAEHPAWKNQDEAWTPDQPLLAKVRPFRPSERESRFSGRVYTIADYIESSLDSRTDTFVRAGTDLLYENAFGGGGDLHADFEVNHRVTDVPDGDDQTKSRVRLDRLSYSWGGDRFASERFELGRFLQHDMPEFGVLDGIEWDRRLGGGSRIGASLGFMPEPTAEQTTGNDLQAAAWYRWVSDESERFSIGAGYQKTYHNGSSDRDLIVGRFHYLPIDAWNVDGTVWLDVYTASDDAKGSGIEPTQAYTSLSRHWDNGSDVRLSYTHLAFPEIKRDEFLPVTTQQLADDHNDRASIYTRQPLGSAIGISGEIGGWKDQDNSGGDAEVGFDVRDILVKDSRVDVAAYGTDGSFTRVLGWRASIGVDTRSGRWSLGYEFALQNQDGFSSNNDDLPLHRVRANWDLFTSSGWSFSTHVEGVFFDQETSILAGVYMQRSF